MTQITGTYTQLPDGKTEISFQDDSVRGRESEIANIIGRTLSEPQVITNGESVKFFVLNTSSNTILSNGAMLRVHPLNGHTPFVEPSILERYEKEGQIRKGYFGDGVFRYIVIRNGSFVELYPDSYKPKT